MKKILQYGNGVLRQKATPYLQEELNDQLNSLIETMVKTMKEANGIGLAAPQIGVSKKLFLTYVDDLVKVYINPEILYTSPVLCEFEEGCLSVPDIYEIVKRPESIQVRYLDHEFNLIQETLSEVDARVFLHEYDHLEGKLFTDHLSTLKKKLLKKRLKQIELTSQS